MGFEKMKKLNLNEHIRVKLNDRGRDIYYHRFDDLIARGVRLERRYPDIDEYGYTTFQLWSFMHLYGPYMYLGAPDIFEDLSIYFDVDLLDDVN